MIRISKTQSRVTAALALIIFITFGINLVRQNAKSSYVGIGSISNSETDEPKVGFILNNFHRTETKSGKKVWEITADKGQYFAETDTAKLLTPYMVFYQKNGDVVEITAEQATLEFDKNVLNTAYLTGTVKMNVNKEKFITTEKADFHKIEDTLIAPGYAKIEDGKMILEGETLKVNLSEGILTYDKNVRTQIKPVKK